MKKLLQSLTFGLDLELQVTKHHKRSGSATRKRRRRRRADVIGLMNVRNYLCQTAYTLTDHWIANIKVYFIVICMIPIETSCVLFQDSSVPGWALCCQILLKQYKETPQSLPLTLTARAGQCWHIYCLAFSYSGTKYSFDKICRLTCS